MKSCKTHRHWTIEQWKCAFWNMESGFSFWQADGHVCSQAGQILLVFAKPIVPTQKFGDVNKESSELMQEDFRRQTYILSRGLYNLIHIVEPGMYNIIHKKQYRSLQGMYKARSTKAWLEDWCWKTYLAPTELWLQSHWTPLGWTTTSSSTSV